MNWFHKRFLFLPMVSKNKLIKWLSSTQMGKKEPHLNDIEDKSKNILHTCPLF